MGREHPFKSLLKVVCLWRPVRPPRSLSPETEVTTGSQFSCILLCTDKWLSICLNSPPHAKGSRVSALKVSCYPAEVCVPLPFRYWRTLSSTQHTAHTLPLVSTSQSPSLPVGYDGCIFWE